MNYQHLLVPVELNDHAGTAIHTALQLAAQFHAQTTLMYVIEAIDQQGETEDDDDSGGLESFYAELERGIRQQMARAAEPFRNAGLEVAIEIVIGHGPREIIQYSATKSVDLIVMRSERVDLNRPYENISTASHQVSLFCQCPVMLVK